MEHWKLRNTARPKNKSSLETLLKKPLKRGTLENSWYETFWKVPEKPQKSDLFSQVVILAITDSFSNHFLGAGILFLFQYLGKWATDPVD